MSNIVRPLSLFVRGTCRSCHSLSKTSNVQVKSLPRVCVSQSRALVTSSNRSSDKPAAPEQSLTDFHHPSDNDKRILVWTKMYSSVEDIPKTVSYSTIRKSRDMFRVRVNIAMIGATVVGCIIMVFIGKRASARGDGLTKRGIEWQQRMREEGIREEQMAKDNANK